MNIIDKLFKNNKTQNIHTNELYDEKIISPDHLCKSCQDQCAGHGGGGVSTLDGGCLCFDGVRLECLI